MAPKEGSFYPKDTSGGEEAQPSPSESEALGNRNQRTIFTWPKNKKGAQKIILLDTLFL